MEGNLGGLHFLGHQLTSPPRGWNLLRPTIRLFGPERPLLWTGRAPPPAIPLGSRRMPKRPSAAGTGVSCLPAWESWPTALPSGQEMLQSRAEGCRLLRTSVLRATQTPAQCSSAPPLHPMRPPGWTCQHPSVGSVGPLLGLPAISSPPFKQALLYGLGLFTCIYINRQTYIPP